jgi:hypothetical protein
MLDPPSVPGPVRDEQGKHSLKHNAAAIVAAGGIPLASTPLLEGWSARVTGGLGVKSSG